MSVIEQCQSRFEALPHEIVMAMEKARPTVVHEKAHVYPISVPEMWHNADESVIDWAVPLDKPLRLYG